MFVQKWLVLFTNDNNSSYAVFWSLDLCAPTGDWFVILDIIHLVLLSWESRQQDIKTIIQTLSLIMMRYIFSQGSSFTCPTNMELSFDKYLLICSNGTVQSEQLHVYVLVFLIFSKELQTSYCKHCQRHNGPRVLSLKLESSLQLEISPEIWWIF